LIGSNAYQVEAVEFVDDSTLGRNGDVDTWNDA